jgi:hypothetical protein
LRWDPLAGPPDNAISHRFRLFHDQAQMLFGCCISMHNLGKQFAAAQYDAEAIGYVVCQQTQLRGINAIVY